MLPCIGRAHADQSSHRRNHSHGVVLVHRALHEAERSGTHEQPNTKPNVQAAFRVLQRCSAAQHNPHHEGDERCNE